jgi:protein-disulfide isomerase
VPLVTVVEFSEFECELCRQGADALRSALQRHRNEVRAVWKNYPLPQHRLARRAAGFALEARRLGGDSAFFAAADALFVPGTKLDDAGLERAAERAGLEVGALVAAARTTAHDPAIDADLALARRLGVSGAPTYFVNGRKIPGALTFAELEALLREELALARRVKAQGAGSVADLACGQRPSPAVAEP